MSINFNADDHITKTKSKLVGQLNSYAARKNKAVENAIKSYQEKYGDASVFDVAKAQKNITTQSAQAQTPQQQTQMQAGGIEGASNAMHKLMVVITEVVTNFNKVIESIKTALYSMTTQDPGQQTATPKNNIGTNNQGAQGQQKAVKQDEKSMAGSTTEVVDKTVAEQDPKDNPINENDAQTSSQLDEKAIEKFTNDLKQNYLDSFNDGQRMIDKQGLQESIFAEFYAGVAT